MSGIEPDSFTTFGELLKYLRQRARMTQRQLGVAVGYSDAQITRLESGQRLPDATAVKARFFEALDLGNEPEWAARLVRLAEGAHGDSESGLSVPYSSHTPQPANPPIELNEREEHAVDETALPSLSSTSTVMFVGREPELKRLQVFLDRALVGHGQVVFVTGEAGSGKTSLLSAFTAQARIAHSALQMALGTCNAQGGIGDPYLPFREVLTMLTSMAGGYGDTELNMQARSVQVLFEEGPDLIGTMVSGRLLLAKLGKTATQRVGVLAELEKLIRRKEQAGNTPGLEQSRIFEQYANVLIGLSERQPLLIILDDLHWADDASITLLFHLSRRIEHSRILLIGAYRMDEVAPARGSEHTKLEKVLAEIKHHSGDVWIDLGDTTVQSSRAFVDQIVDSEPNLLDERFRQALYERTDGHALFTVELLHTLQERGDLLRDADGRWIAGPKLDWETGSIPARVEGAIEERMGRLDDAQRDLLRAASVEGVDFTAEVVAQVQQVPARQMFRELALNLEKRHRLVHERGELQVGKQRLMVYQFTHALFQQFLYDELDSATRRLLHGDVARAIEQCYADLTDDLSARLAWHYELAGEDDKAVDYLIRAGERALSQGAPREAHNFFTHALQHLSKEDHERRWQALLGCESALALPGETSERRGCIAELLALAEMCDDDAWRAVAYQRQAKHALDASDFQLAIRAAESAIAAAQRSSQREIEVLALAARVIALGFIQDGSAFRTEAVCQSAEELLSRTMALGTSPVSAFALHEAACFLGDEPMRQELHFRQSADMAHELGERAIEGLALVGLGGFYRDFGLYGLAKETLQTAMQLCQSVGALDYGRVALLYISEVLIEIGDVASATPRVERVLAEFRTVGKLHLIADCLLLLAEAAFRINDLDTARQHTLESREASLTCGLHNGVMRADGMLARCALARGHLDEAQNYIKNLWDFLQRQLSGWSRELMTCADVFEAMGDGHQARQAIDLGYAAMMTCADKITNAEWRASYLRNVKDNATLVARWRAIHPDASDG